MRKVALALTSFFLTSAVWAGGMCMTAQKCGMGGGCSFGGGMSLKAPIFLALLALGYWILRIAEKEQAKLLKRVGRGTAWIILIGSLLGLLCPLVHCGKKGGACGKGMMGDAKSAATCPYSGGAVDASTEMPVSATK